MLSHLPSELWLALCHWYVSIMQGARRFGSDEAPPIDWLSPPSSWSSSASDRELSEMFAYHSVTMANTVRAPLLVFSK
jgi:hypothetical protein